jgi:hypothetical protein
MRLTRRNALIGLGTVAAGAGVVGGSGAFSSVTAQRSVTVETAGDGSAALTLEPDSGSNGSEYVAETDGTIVINLDGVDGGDATSKGINQNAVTKLRNLVTVTNNGTQEITSLLLRFSETPTDVDASATFDFTASNTDDSTQKQVDDNSDILASPDSLSLTVGDSVDFGIVVDLLNGGVENDLPEGGSYTLEIEAQTS